MKKNMLLIVVCGLFLLTAVSVPANAQFYLGVRGGLSNENAKAGEVKFDRNSAFLYGAQVGIKFMGFAIEGQYYHSDHDLLGGESGQLDLEIPLQMDYDYFGVNGKLGIPLAIVYPYITAGYGWYSVDLKNVFDESTSAFNVGAGAELTLGKIGIFGELRYTDFSIEFENTTWDFGGLDLHFGLNIHF
jgi:opacity protein-like surface antigen